MGAWAKLDTSFGNWVRRRRKALDLTQNQLAQRVGCSPSLIFKIETDERRPSRQIAELLAAQLELPPDQRAAFIKVARQEMAALRMTSVEQPLQDLPALTQDAPNQIENAAAQPATLPVFPTQFIGREHEIDIIVQQIMDPTCRLLTLTGPGGVGKTRLAVEVARRLNTAFQNGVYFLPMVGTSQSDAILQEIANALGITFSGPADPKRQVIQSLQKKKVLLVIDNMEHLVDSGPVLGELLQHAPGLKMLLTSREPIRLQWEWIFDVQGLPIPESAEPGILVTHSAPALFLLRAQQSARQAGANGGDEPQQAPGTDTAAIIQICKLVDGLPLAIELAASWARVMSPAEIAEELAKGLDLLETNLQDVPARHRSIRLVFDQSWKLLTEPERAALMKLAVFPGGFTREAALAAEGVPVTLLSAFVSKSLLRYGRKDGRYDFHELIRQYALDRLSENPDQEHTAYAQMAGYYANWLEGMERQIKSAQQMTASAKVQAETANWNTAWRWAAQQKRLDLLRRMNACIYWYDEIHGFNTEAVSATDLAIREMRAAGAPSALTSDVQIASFALMVDQLGWFEFRIGNVDRAAALFAESLEIAQNLTEPDHEVLYYIYVNWGYMNLQTGELERSNHLSLMSLEHARAMGGQWHAAISINILGILEYQRGHLQEAYRQLTGSLKLWREVGDLRGLVFCMLHLSATMLALEDYENAESILRESNAIALQKHDQWAHAFGLDLLGNVAIARGQVQPAMEYYRKSLALSQEIGDTWAAALTYIHMGEAQLAANDRVQAHRLFRQAYETARKANWTSTILQVLVASLAAQSGIPDETRFAVALAVLSHPSATLTTRQRAEGLRAQLESTLSPEQREIIACQEHPILVEEWAEAYFQNIRVEGGQSEESTWDWLAGITRK